MLQRRITQVPQLATFFAFSYPKQILGGSEDILDTIFEIFEENYLQYIRGVHVGYTSHEQCDRDS